MVLEGFTAYLNMLRHASLRCRAVEQFAIELAQDGRTVKTYGLRKVFEGFRLAVRFPGSRQMVGKPSGLHPAGAARNLRISNEFAWFRSFHEQVFILLTPPYIARSASLRENLWFAQGF